MYMRDVEKYIAKHILLAMVSAVQSRLHPGPRRLDGRGAQRPLRRMACGPEDSSASCSTATLTSALTKRCFLGYISSQVAVVVKTVLGSHFNW